MAGKLYPSPDLFRRRISDGEHARQFSYATSAVALLQSAACGGTRRKLSASSARRLKVSDPNPGGGMHLDPRRACGRGATRQLEDQGKTLPNRVRHAASFSSALWWGGRSASRKYGCSAQSRIGLEKAREGRGDC